MNTWRQHDFPCSVTVLAKYDCFMPRWADNNFWSCNWSGHKDQHIVSTVAGSPAQRAGVRTGDRLIWINGVMVSTLTHSVLSRTVGIRSPQPHPLVTFVAGSLWPGVVVSRWSGAGSPWRCWSSTAAVSIATFAGRCPSSQCWQNVASSLTPPRPSTWSKAPTDTDSCWDKRGWQWLDVSVRPDGRQETETPTSQSADLLQLVMNRRNSQGQQKLLILLVPLLLNYNNFRQARLWFTRIKKTYPSRI